MNSPLTSPEARELRALMDHTMDEVVATRDFATTAVAVGRGQRRRRHVMGAAAAVGLIASSAFGAAHLVGGNRPVSAQVAASDSTSTSPSPAPTATSQSPEPAITYAEGWWMTPADTMLQRIKPLLPADVSIASAQTQIDDKSTGGRSPALGYLTLTLAAPGGAANPQLDVLLVPPDSARLTQPDEATLDGAKPISATEMIACPEDADPAGATVCRELYDAAGAQVGSVVGFEQGGQGLTTLTMLTSDQGAVQLTLSAPQTAGGPALTHQQLRAIAQDVTWTDWTPAP